jgi:hypothetical protein
VSAPHYFANADEPRDDVKILIAVDAPQTAESLRTLSYRLLMRGGRSVKTLFYVRLKLVRPIVVFIVDVPWPNENRLA